MRFATLVCLLLSSISAGDASILHWTTRLLHTECDDRPVPQPHRSGLVPRRAETDHITPIDFEAERTLTAGTTLSLAVCHGEVHILPSNSLDQVRVLVHLNDSLKDRTPTDFLQQFTFAPGQADVEWKLPERSHPVISIYVPTGTKLNLQLGKVDVDVKGVRGDKSIDVGKGTARLYVRPDEYRAIEIAVAMGSFTDQRPGGTTDHKVPLHEHFDGPGQSLAEMKVAMGQAELVPE
jgi:hypothetical protein